MTFKLVRYIDDGMLYVCNEKFVKCKDKVTFVQYSNRNWYSANILASGEKQCMLSLRQQLSTTIKVSLSDNDPCIFSTENSEDTQISHSMLESSRNLLSNITLPESHTPTLTDDCIPFKGIDQGFIDHNNLELTTLDSTIKPIAEYVSVHPSPVLELVVAGCDEVDDQMMQAFNLPAVVPVQPISPVQQFARPVAVQSSQSGSKKYMCVYCKKLYAKLPRHLETVHANEQDIKTLMALPKNSPDRSALLSKFRGQGILTFNTNSEYNHGNLIVSRRPLKKNARTVDHYLPCSLCGNYFSKITLYRHTRKCDTRGTHSQDKATNRCMARRYHELSNPRMAADILPYLRSDLIGRTARYDSLIIQFGNKMSLKYGAHLNYHIRQTMRTLSRFLLTIKQVNPEISHLSTIFEPRHYNDVLAAVNILAVFNPEDNTYRKPALATQLGTLIKKCANLQIVEYIKREEPGRKQSVKDFMKLHTEEYGTCVNKAATNTQIQCKRNKPVNLPLQEDIVKLHTYLSKQFRTLVAALKQKYSIGVWTELAKVVMTSLLLFNRRRAGEMERLLLSDFSKRQIIETDSDLFKTLNNAEQLLARRYVRVELRGKLGRTVPILLSSEQVAAIELLLQHRIKANVSDENVYVFGYGRNKFFRACIALKAFSVKCTAKKPCLLRGTKLRKQIATSMQVLNLECSELEQLARFLGHDIQIHKDIYRLPDGALQIGQISKLLLSVQDGTYINQRGRTLNELVSEGPSAELPLHTDRQSSVSDSPRPSVSGLQRSVTPVTLSSENPQSYCISLKTPVKRKKHLQRSVTTPPSGSLYSPSTSCSPEMLHKTPTKRFKRRLAPVSPYGRVVRRSWSTPERHVARKVFHKCLVSGTLPSGLECQNAIQKYSELKNRTAKQLKAWINNQCRNKFNM